MCDGSDATSWSHDSLGRILKDQRIINGTSAANKNVQYTFYKDGELNTLIYPSGRVLTYTLKTGGTCNGGSCTSGRPVAAGDGTTNYVSAVIYAPHGAPASFTQDASIHAGFSYNSRLQPLQMAFGTGTLPSLTGTTCPAGASIMHRLYDFHSAAATDNGNVHVINNCRDSNRTQNFFYDNLNRITQAYTNGNSPLTTSWGETFTIDAWGNLTNKGPVSGKANTETLNAAPASTKNQLNGFCNDAAGNLILNAPCPTGTFTPTYSYDIENRLSSTNGRTYVYDGDGKRVKKCSSCGTSTGGTIYWPSSAADTVLESDLAGTRKYEYMFFNGQRIARCDGTNPPSSYFPDHLGSADAITNNAGGIQKESDYYPYGGEIVVNGADPNNYKFTGKERDAESVLDNFGARYDASSLGRFMTPDPMYIEMHRLADPQRLNLYAYARNNPTTLTDPTGLDVALKCDTKENCNKAVQDFNGRKDAKFKVELGKDGKLHVVKGSVAKGIGGAEGKLLGAINDSNNHATINVSGSIGQSEFGTHDSKSVNSVDLGNLSKLDAASNAGGLNSGDALAHEAMDAYYSLSMGADDADAAAADLFPGLLLPRGGKVDVHSGALYGQTLNQPISNGSGTERVTMQYVTPIPMQDLRGKTPQAIRDTERATGSSVTGVTFVPPNK